MISTMVVKVVFIGMVEEEVMMSSKVNRWSRGEQRCLYLGIPHKYCWLFIFSSLFTRNFRKVYLYE